MSYRENTDGVDHINASCVGRTMLGLMLHNGAYAPIIHPEFGPFTSITGFWGWLVTGRRNDIFRHLYGEMAYRTIGNYPIVYDQDLAAKIAEAIEIKLHQNLTLMDMFRMNRSLPYVSYGSAPRIQCADELQLWSINDDFTLDQMTYFQTKYACG